MPTAKQLYVKKLNEIAGRYGQMEDETIRQALAMLKDLRSQVAAELANVGDDWNRFRLQEFSRSIDLLVAQYQANLGAQVRRAFRQAVIDGAETVAEPLKSLGFNVAFFRPSAEQINVALDFSADLVKKISDDVRNQINDQVRRAALGQQPPLAAMKGITQALGVEARTGIWKKRIDPVKGVAARAETDLRTELQRFYNLATYSQQQATATQIPGLLKGWVATGDARTRDSHLQAHLTYKENPIPIDQPFVLKDRQGQAELMYPGDPQAPARFTINCRCRPITIHPAVGRIGSDLDGRIAAELKRREG